MCGIIGSFNWPAFDVAAGVDRLKHRGPDAQHVTAVGAACHGHARLSLVDLSAASDQPFRYGTGLLSFVGEIWNFRQLRDELAGFGHRFRTSGDTEVLAAALSEWGWSALPRLEGMFTFAWSAPDCDILARDRYGKVPLYLHRSRDRWAWSSERKGFPPGLPAAAVPPGSMVDLRTGACAAWYRLPPRGTANAPLELLLETAVERRLLADAPLCCLISGGLDSSLILTMAKRHKPELVAYVAALDTDSGDLKAARRLCAELEVPLREVRVAPPDAEALARAARTIEIPMKAQVEIAALCLPLAQAIASDGFKACLSGEAADELFGGYGSMCIKGSSADDAGWRAIRVAQLEKMARGNFIRCNKAFMAYGVECRLPFMDRELVERVLGESKAECPPGKRSLKAAALRAGIPEWIVRRTKDTFQGGAGLDDAAARVLADPAAFYRAEIISAYGQSAVARGAN